MKKVMSFGLLAILIVGSAGFAGYRLTASRADTPDCCKNKEACCPGSSCCTKDQHGARHCSMHATRV